MRRKRKKKAGICLAIGLLAAVMTMTPFQAFIMTALAAEAWTMKNGQYVDASGFPIEGAVAKGITVTKYQNRANADSGGIDWAKVKADGISFAMIRIGYYKDMDPYYSMNMKGAAENGLKTGVFFYTQALDTDSAVAEANYVLDMVRDYAVSYPIAYDVESRYLLDNGLTKQQITDNINAFCKTISDAGYRPVLYTNQQWLSSHMDGNQIPYDVWYARYGIVNNCRNRTIWQCTDKGTVDGVDGNVTIELAFADYGALIPPEGWKHIGGNWYYMKAYVKQTGWMLADGKRYYLDPNGAMIHDTTMDIDGTSYTFGPDGAMAE